MKKIFLFLAITIMVICNCSFAKAVNIECHAPNFEGSPDFYYTVKSGVECHLALHICYYCDISYPGVDQSITVLGWTFCCPPGTAVSLDEMNALADLAVTELLENWYTICGVQPCTEPSTYTYNVSLPVCVRLQYSNGISELVTCTTDANNYCSQTIKMCWNGEKAHWKLLKLLICWEHHLALL
jgi:hypothetical protein